MPKYRITLQNDSNLEPHRRPRDADAEPLFVETRYMMDAMLHALEQKRPSQRVVSVEEVLSFDMGAITDEQIVGALTSPTLEPGTRLNPDDYEGFVWESSPDHADILNSVADALRDSGLVSGLTLSILHDDVGLADYVMVEIFDKGSNSYRSIGSEPRHLIENRDLTGWEAVISVARTLMSTVSSHGLL